MPLDAVKPKHFHSNKIKFAIEKKAFEKGDGSLKDELYTELQNELGLSNRFFRILNNTVQPTVQELAIIAQALNINDIWELLKLEE